MRTALTVAITVTFTIGAQAQTRDDRSSGGSVQAAGKGRVETQAQCEAQQQQTRAPSSVSAFRRVMRRGSATNDGRGDEPDTGMAMHHGMERAKGIEPSYAAWESFYALTISIRYNFLAPFWLRFFAVFHGVLC